MSITQDKMRIINSLKLYKKLPSIDATIDWLFAHLEKQALGELKSIADFLDLPHPLKNDDEIQSQYTEKRKNDR